MTCKKEPCRCGRGVKGDVGDDDDADLPKIKKSWEVPGYNIYNCSGLLKRK